MNHRQTQYEYAPSTRRRLNDELDTPWRYRCPECDSTMVVIRETNKAKALSAKRYKEYEPRAHYAADRTHIHDFRCDECGAVFDEPFDGKEGECHAITER